MPQKKKKCPGCGQVVRWLTRTPGDDRETYFDGDVQEDLGDGYLHTLCSAAGLEAVKPGRDRKGTDWQISSHGFSWDEGADLKVQMKCKLGIRWSKQDDFRFALEERRYELLRKPFSHLPILVVVVPRSASCETWVEMRRNSTLVRAVAYFSVIPYTKWADRAEKGVRLRREDVLTHQKLLRLLQVANDYNQLKEARNGGRPWD